MLQALYATILEHLAPATAAPSSVDGFFEPRSRRVTAIKDGYKLVELPQGKPDAPARLHTFADVESFAAYVKKHLTDTDACEILAGETCIVAIDRASWAHDQVHCTVPLHPDLVKWKAILNQPFSQGKLFKVLTPLKHTFKAETPNQELLIDQLRALKIDESGGVDVQLNALGMHTVRNSASSSAITTKLDSRVIVSCPVYRDGPKFTFELALTLDNENGGLKFALVAVDLEVVMHDAHLEMVSRLRSLLGDAYLVGLGDLKLG